MANKVDEGKKEVKTNPEPVSDITWAEKDSELKRDQK